MRIRKKRIDFVNMNTEKENWFWKFEYGKRDFKIDFDILNTEKENWLRKCIWIRKKRIDLENEFEYGERELI